MTRIQSNFRIVAIEVGDPNKPTYRVSVYDSEDGENEEEVYARYLTTGDASIVRPIVGNENAQLLEAIKSVLRRLDGKDQSEIIENAIEAASFHEVPCNLFYDYLSRRPYVKDFVGIGEPPRSLFWDMEVSPTYENTFAMISHEYDRVSGAERPRFFLKVSNVNSPWVLG